MFNCNRTVWHINAIMSWFNHLCSGRFYIPTGLYVYTACLVCGYCNGWWCKWKVGCLTSPLSDFVGLLHIWWDLVYSADDGDGATTQAAAWHESKMHILSNTTGNVAIENFKKILIDDFCIPRDTTARHYTTIIPAIETWGNFLLTTVPSETRWFTFWGPHWLVCYWLQDL